ncbi:MAG: acyltransferase domain-containing protein, partial [Verrucomicrobia bacterium]|nr:acyltransferase domain-containing protein [Verrucomicrobiota bacterium]
MKDTFPNVSASPNQSRVDTLKTWLVRELARVLAISEDAIATNEPFSRFGLDSAKAVELLNRLGELLGHKVPVTVAWSHPTIEKLSNYLCGNPDSESEMSRGWSSTVPVRNQPIAVIGVACRFPGAPDPGTFWEMLRSGRSAIREITPDRWDIEAWYDPDVNKPGKMNARRAGLLESIDQFDPGFFGISPREAVQMDPQQRLALELAWEALEDAGLRPGALRGSRTGLFVGVAWHDYETLARKAGAEITLHSGTGQAFSVVANRISYALGFQGPSIALDTACSSSLVSVHLACRSLQFGDATLAIAGGVNLIIDPATMVTLSKFGGLSPTSELCAFDARANGFVRGEGGGFVVLKPLSRALADGDPIYAVIRGTAANNDGASNGLTAPNPLAQQAVMREAYVGTGIRTEDVQYVEAHGTGTQLGDPIEAQALGDVFGSERSGDQPLLVGSVKTNIGHLEGAAGIAGLIKLILSVKHRSIPPSLNFEIPNPHIDFAKVQVVTGLKPWPETTKPAIGGVSAFGWGGTNCHVVVEEPARSSAHLLPLSAPDTGSLQGIAAELRNYLGANAAKLSLVDVCATAAARCERQPERVALTARSLNELRDQLDGFLQGQKRPGIAVGHGVLQRPKLAFIFSPQGSQWIGMGKSLIAAEPVFKTKLVECERAVTKLAGWSLFDLLLSDESQLNGVQFIQPALAAIQIALAELWNSWGVRPDFVAAHSLGEWAAACVAGALTVEETMRIVVESSRAQALAGPGGGMAIVELPQEEVVARVREFAQEVFVSGQNSPTSTVLSGDAGRLKTLVADWKNEGLTCSLIEVDVAAHSPWMDPVLDNLKVSLRGLHPTRTVVPLISSVLGGPVSGTEVGPEHWARHLRQPVLFREVVEHLSHETCTIFLEVSPHPLLLGGIAQTLSTNACDGVTLGSCRRGADERESLLTSLGTLYVLGWPLEWSAVTSGGKTDLALPIPALSESFPVDGSSKPAPFVLPLSSHTPIALRDRARSVAKYLRTNPETRLDDVLHTLGTGREPLEYRLAVAGVDREKLTSTLETFARGQDVSDLDVNIGRARSGVVPRVAFVCSGQGPQWYGMGRELLSSIPIFRKEIARCADEMKRHVSWDLLKELERDEAGSRLQETQVAQPALFALQVALAAVWRSWGIVPDALVGHSVGEIAAAYLSGALSFEDAVMVVCCRGRIMQHATGLGRMAALEISEPEAEKLLQLYLDRVSIAAVNSPTSIVISGESGAIDEITKTALGLGVRIKILPVDYAFHSSQMEPFRKEMAQSIPALRLQPPLIPVYSTVTGKEATAEDFGPEYWGCNIRQTVRFATAVTAMLDAGTDIFVELSPHPVLSGMIAQCGEAGSKSGQQLPSLRRGVSEPLQLRRSLAALFAAGREVDWTGVFSRGGRVVPLPTYPWQRKRYWFEVSPESPGLDTSTKLGISATHPQRPIHGRRL